jgi:hypothetical protein
MAPNTGATKAIVKQTKSFKSMANAVTPSNGLYKKSLESIEVDSANNEDPSASNIVGKAKTENSAPPALITPTNYAYTLRMHIVHGHSRIQMVEYM